MIEISISDGSLNVIDWFQIAASVGTVIAALMALITTIQNKRTSNMMKTERHMMFKPIFTIVNTFENRHDKIIKIGSVNLGFDRIMNSINCEWEGNEGVKLKVKEFLTKNKKDFDIEITINYSECPEEDIRGKLFLVYTDVLGKQYKECVEIEINYIYDDFIEVNNPVLNEKLLYKRFVSL